LADSLSNRAAGATESAFITEQSRPPVRPHGERMNFESKLTYIRFLSEFAGGLRVTPRLFQSSHPLPHQFHNPVANASRPIVEFKRSSGEEAASGEDLLLAARKPILAKRLKTLDPMELPCGADYSLDENFACFIHDGALQILFGTEVGEETALADSQRRSELSDRQPFEPFE
jgi:hypothetical protein